jgi:hypothetical protein
VAKVGKCLVQLLYKIERPVAKRIAPGLLELQASEYADGWRVAGDAADDGGCRLGRANDRLFERLDVFDSRNEADFHRMSIDPISARRRSLPDALHLPGARRQISDGLRVCCGAKAERPPRRRP